MDDNGEQIILQAKKKTTSVRMVTAMHTNRSHRKGCVLLVVHISSDKGKEVEDADVLRRYTILKQFQDVFPEDIIEFPPHREVDSSIQLVLQVAPTSKAPYMMSTPKWVGLKL